MCFFFLMTIIDVFYLYTGRDLELKAYLLCMDFFEKVSPDQVFPEFVRGIFSGNLIFLLCHCSCLCTLQVIFNGTTY